MCSIIGYCGRPADLTAFQAGFARTVSRGPDDSRVIDVGQGILGFHRLSIMGLHPEGMQPFGLNGSWVVCNGEIYGFEKLKKELSKDYTFTSESDCEVLLPMYEKYGVGMFAKLDAEFACIIFDKENGSYIAARDPIGIRPLFYGYEKIHRRPRPYRHSPAVLRLRRKRHDPVCQRTEKSGGAHRQNPAVSSGTLLLRREIHLLLRHRSGRPCASR